MLFLSFSSISTTVLLIHPLYCTLIVSALFYMMPIIVSFDKTTQHVGIKSLFIKISGGDVMNLISLFLSHIIIVLLFWSSNEISSWFNNLQVNSFQIRMMFLILFTFYLSMQLFTSTSYFSSKEVYDLLISKINFVLWFMILFQSNSLITTIFIVETISSLIFLFVITSVTSTHYNYNNKLTISGHNFFNVFPTTYIQSLMYYYWVSLISSLNLFLFVLFTYYNLFTLDWTLMELSFTYLCMYGTWQNLVSMCIVWFFFIFCMFLKCGIAPLYIWKPTFFKGLPINSMVFYVLFVYFFLFLFFIVLLTTSLSNLFYYYSLVTFVFISLGFITLLSISCEALFIKTFIAVSSIINSLLVLIAIVSNHTISIPTLTL